MSSHIHTKERGAEAIPAPMRDYLFEFGRCWLIG